MNKTLGVWSIKNTKYNILYCAIIFSITLAQTHVR